MKSIYETPIAGLTAPQKLKHLILLDQLNLCALEANADGEMGLSVSRLEASDFEGVNADTIDALYERTNCDRDAIDNIRCNWTFETDIDVSDAETNECIAASVGRPYLDGSFIGWTVWIAKNGEKTGNYEAEQRMPWIDQAYDLKSVRTFTKVEADHE